MLFGGGAMLGWVCYQLRGRTLISFGALHQLLLIHACIVVGHSLILAIENIRSYGG